MAPGLSSFAASKRDRFAKSVTVLICSSLGGDGVFEAFFMISTARSYARRISECTLGETHVAEHLGRQPRHLRLVGIDDQTFVIGYLGALVDQLLCQQELKRGAPLPHFDQSISASCVGGDLLFEGRYFRERALLQSLVETLQ